MVTMVEKIRFELYLKKRLLLYYYGFKNKLIKFYTDDEDIMERFRNTYYGGVPLSIMLLCPSWTSKKCYDKTLITAYAFHDVENVKHIDADVRSIMYDPANIDEFRKALGYLPEHYGNHSIIEVTDKNGITWVIDTTKAFITEKNLYYKIEKPIITKVNNKEDILANPEYQDMLNQDVKNDISNIPLLLPMIESIIEKEYLYKEELKKELKLFKEKINYDKVYEDYMREKEEYMKSIMA